MTDNNIRIVIAEDDFLVCEEIKRILRGTPYEVVGEASNGKEAITLTEELKPDVILMDIKMPIMDGLKASAQICKQCPTPIVILTAYESNQLVEQASLSGVGAFLNKPPQFTEIDRAITIAMARHKDLIEIRHLNEQLNKAQEISHLGHWELSLDTHTLYWSDEIYRIFETDPQNFNPSYDAFLEFVHPQDREFVDKAYNDSILNHKTYDIEHRILCHDGSEKWVHEIGSTEYDEDGKAIKTIGTVHDITELKILRGILPICSKCKKIRNDEGYWQQVDQYITDHSNIFFSHSLCIQCSDSLYGGEDWYEKAKKEGKLSY